MDELHDLRDVPREMKNLIGTTGAQPAHAELKAQLARWMQETN